MAKSYTSRPPGLVSVRLDLTEQRHAALRVLAAKAGLPMSQFARSIVEAHIDAHAGPAAAPETPPKKNSRKKG